MLARIRAGDKRFIAAASGPREARSPCCACTPGVVRDLDVTAAYGIEAACLRKAQRLPDSGQPSPSAS
jgi:hypothetical protein